MNLIIADAGPAHTAQIQAIYAHWVLHGLASFEEVPPDSVEKLVQKLTNTQGASEGGPMPQPVEGIMWHPPDPAKLKTLRCWIANGAQNN